MHCCMGAGRYILVGRSVAGEALVPLPPKTIRADMLLEGFLIKPVRTAQRDIACNMRYHTRRTP